MLHQKHILGILFSLLISFSVNGFASPVERVSVGLQGSVSESSPELKDVRIISAEGILQTSVKVSESNVPAFQNFKHGKRNSSFALVGFSIAGSGSIHDSYFILRMNRISVSPFYIAYHRLII